MYYKHLFKKREAEETAEKNSQSEIAHIRIKVIGWKKTIFWDNRKFPSGDDYQTLKLCIKHNCQMVSKWSEKTGTTTTAGNLIEKISFTYTKKRKSDDFENDYEGVP